MHSPDGTDGTTGTGTRDDKDKEVTSIAPLTALDEIKDQEGQVQKEQDVKITDVEKEEAVHDDVKGQSWQDGAFLIQPNVDSRIMRHGQNTNEGVILIYDWWRDGHD